MKKEVQTIDMTPTWEAIMPGLIMALQNGTGEGPKMAREELMRLARLVDEANAAGKAAKEDTPAG